MRWSSLQPVMIGLPVLFAALLLAEFLFEFLDWRERHAFKSQHRPFYSWRMESTSGKPLSWQQGLVRLQLDPEVGYRNSANQQTPFFSTNELGARSAPSVHLSPQPLILVLGGSFAFGTGLEHNEETFASRLDELLDNAAVLNAAVVGYASAQEDLLQRKLFRIIHPEVVISAGGWNDFHYFMKGMDATQAVFGESLPQIEGRLFRLRSLDHPNPAIRYWENLLNGLLPALTDRLSQMRFGERSDLETGRHDLRDIVQEYVYRLSLMNDRCQRNNCTFLAVIQPDVNAMRLAAGEVLESPQLQDFSESYNLFRESVKRELARKQIRFLDLNDFSSSLPPGRFFDSIHLDSKGQEFVADRIHRHLVEYDFLPGKTMF